VSELPLGSGGPDISATAHDAAQGHVVHLTERWGAPHAERQAAKPFETAAGRAGNRRLRVDEQADCAWRMNSKSGSRRAAR
jgi:hypothetical protein